MKKVAKLVAYSLMTRVVVDEHATDKQIVNASKSIIKLKVQDELHENLESIEDDDECPIGTFNTDLPTIKKVILSPSEKQYVVIGDGLPIQIISFNDYSDWDTVNDTNGDPVFDVQIDFDDSVKMLNKDRYYQFQYVNLGYNDNGDCVTGFDYYMADELIISKVPLTTALGDLLNKLIK